MLAAGSRTQTWDYDNRLSSVTASGSTTSMVYDYTGMRTEKSGPLGTTIFPFSGYEIGPGGISVKYIRIGIENVASKKSTGEKFFYHNDHLGGVNVITNTSGVLAQLIEYDPWGKVSRSEGGGDSLRRFTGKILDPESGLYYYGGRYYDPELGRWISADPTIPYAGDPQSLNRYSYVANNPVNSIDPDGYAHEKVKKKKKKGGFFGGIFGAIFGFVFGGPVGAVIGGSLGAASDFVPEIRTAFRVLQIIGGIGLMLGGNPAGFFMAASGAMSFGKGREWQIGSMFMGLAGSAILLSQSFNSPALAEGQGGHQGGSAGTDSCPTCARGAPQPGDPGVEGPIDARVTQYNASGQATASTRDPTQGSGTWDDPTTVAVARQTLTSRNPSVPYGTRIWIEGHGWARVDDLCGACTPGHPLFSLQLRGTPGIAEVRIDLFVPRDLGIRQIYIVHPPY